MKAMPAQLRSLVIGIGLATLYGCATPESRIRKNTALFESFSPDVQAKVRQGRIDLGFTPDMVTLALGPPHRIHTRISTQGRMDIWIYTTTHSSGDRLRHYPWRFFGYAGNHCHGPPHSGLHAMECVSEYETLRVEFTEGRVTVIEKLER